MTSKTTGRLLLYDEYINLSFSYFRRAGLFISQCYSCSGASLRTKGRKVIGAHSRHKEEAATRMIQLGVVRVEKRKARLS